MSRKIYLDRSVEDEPVGSMAGSERRHGGKEEEDPIRWSWPERNRRRRLRTWLFCGGGIGSERERERRELEDEEREKDKRDKGNKIWVKI